MKHLNLIAYYGGKYPHLKWLLPLFPKGNFHFIDLMCGSANVGLNVSYPLITINDINDDVVNLFTVLRDHHDEFIRKVYFTPFSKTELLKALEQEDFDCKIERARAYYVRCQLGFGANGSQNRHKGGGFEYKIQKTNYYRVDNWNKRLEKLPEIIQKLRSLQIENRDAIELLDKLDKPKTIIYVDPPYLLDTRQSTKKRYRFEIDLEFHEKLLSKLSSLQHPYIAVSGYDSPIYDSLLPGFVKNIAPFTRATVSKVKTQEVLWTNYHPQELNPQLSFFKSQAI